MDSYEIFVQAIGIVAMCMNIFSFLQKKQRSIIVMQFFGALLFTFNYLLLNAITGACLNFIAIIRSIVYSNKEKFHAERKEWIYFFSVLYIAVYVLSFAVFGKEPTAFNLLIELLPVIAMVVTTISFSMKNAASVRKLALIGSPMWLIYNVVFRTYGGVLCEAFSLVSVLVGMFCHDRKRKA